MDAPNPAFAKMLLEQFGGPNGELAAAMRYFMPGWNEPDEKRRSMLLDIATEELSHLEMVARTLHMLLKGSPSEFVDQVEGNYLGDLLDRRMPDYVNLAQQRPEHPRRRRSAPRPTVSAPGVYVA